MTATRGVTSAVRRRRAEALAATGVACMMAATACGSPRARTLPLDPLPTSAPQVAGATVTQTRITRATIPAATRATAASTSTAITATTGASTTTDPVAAPNRCADQAADPQRNTAPTFVGGQVATSGELGVRFSYPTAWSTAADVAVAADQLFNPDLLRELGLRANTTLRPLAARAPSAYPGVAVFRIGALPSSLQAATASMRTRLRERGFVVETDVVAGCIDGEVAVGVIAMNPEIVDAVWFATHGKALYVVLCLGRHDGTARSQSELLTQFEEVLSTIRWLR